MSMPAGRGLYLWYLNRCEGGDVAAIIDRCHRAHVTWVAVKAGDGGHLWSQFTPELVAAFHAAGIACWGWSYDVPGRDAAQTAVVAHVLACGAAGFVVDAEAEWQRRGGDAAAASYLAAIAAVAPGFPLLDAPFPMIRKHQSFPYTAFGTGVGGRCAQVYWVEIGGGVEHVWSEFVDNWRAYEAQPGHLVLPRYPSGSTYHKRIGKKIVRPCTVTDVTWFEAAAKSSGCLGVLHWEWSQVPSEIWAAWESGEIPAW